MATNNDTFKKQKGTAMDDDSSPSLTLAVVSAGLSFENVQQEFPDILFCILPYIADRMIWNAIASSNKDIYKQSKTIHPPWPMDYKLVTTSSYPVISWSPCGTRIAYYLTNHSNIVVVLDQRRGPVRWIAHNGEFVTGLKFSPDGSFLVSGGDDGSVKLWSNNTGNYEVLQEWNVRDDDVARHHYYQTIGSISVSPCSKYVVVSMGNCVFIKDIENRGKTVAFLVPPRFPSTENIVENIFSHDGRAVIIFCKNHDHSFIKVWHPYSNDDEDHLTTIWRRKANNVFDTYEFSYNDSMITMYDMNEEKGTLLCITMDHTCLTQKLTLPGRCLAIYFTPDNKFIVYNTENGPKFWSLAEDEFVDTSLENNHEVMSFSPNNRQLIAQKQRLSGCNGTFYIKSYFLK